MWSHHCTVLACSKAIGDRYPDAIASRHMLVALNPTCTVLSQPMQQRRTSWYLPTNGAALRHSLIPSLALVPTGIGKAVQAVQADCFSSWTVVVAYHVVGQAGGHEGGNAAAVKWQAHQLVQYVQGLLALVLVWRLSSGAAEVDDDLRLIDRV